jgi:lysophospholipase L1-like esterase
VVIMLGTNDSKSNRQAERALPMLESNMEILVKRFKALESNPKIVVVLSPPAYENAFSIQGAVIKSEILPRVRAQAEKLGLQVVDAHTPFGQNTTFFPDGVHPNDQGAAIIAKAVADALKPVITATHKR